MKTKMMVFLVVILAVVAAMAYAANLDFGVGKDREVPVHFITAPASYSSVAVTGAAAFGGILVKTDGTNNVTLNVYDNTSATGRLLIPADTIVLGTARLWALSFEPPVSATTGIYVTISVAGGGAASYQVIYDQG